MALIRDGHESQGEALDFPTLEELLSGNSGDSVTLAPDADLEALAPRLSGLKRIEIEFPKYADGRGFSIARQLRKTHAFDGELIAAGPLLPDQYVFALQCGFDAVRVNEDTYAKQTPEEWRDAMDAFSLTYQRGYAIPMGPAVSVLDARKAKREESMTDQYNGLSAEQALERAIRDDFAGEIVLASSMGIDSAVMLHMISEIDSNLPVLFLETGKHFKETLAYRDRLIAQFGLTNFRSIAPNAKELKAEDPDGDLVNHDKDACCDLRKTRPLDSEITKFNARITGRKRYQTPDRANIPILETGGRQVKLNPLAYWTAKDVTAYMRKHNLPPHPLLALGFLSVGCQPCTTRVSEGEDPRAGRWRGADKTECGIHYIDGKWVRTPAQPQTHEVF